MAVYEYKTQIKYNDISEENKLSGKGLLNILSEAARNTFSRGWIWIKWYRKNKLCLDAFILESEVFKTPKMENRD